MTRMHLSWPEISDAPVEAGVYAWYYRVDITDYDLERITETVMSLKEVGQDNVARLEVEAFLEERVFRFFRELPYLSVLRGPLKPRYMGTIEHQFKLTPDLVSRIVANPARLRSIRDVLRQAAPDFASPIYIGMADNLRARLRKHKKLIQEYGEKHDLEAAVDAMDPEQSFALEVVRRKMHWHGLFVVVKAMTGPDREHNDIENILNRVNYPLLGRN